jgi:uncharacterized protein YqeY
MTLDALKTEMISSMKSGDKFRKNVISAIIAQIKNVAIDKNCRDNITEDMVNEVLLKHKKMIQEMIETCPADRTETLEEYKAQMAVVTEFAPTLISDEVEIKTIVTELADKNGIKLVKSNRGNIMKVVAANLKGKADMGVVSRVVGGMLK